MLRKRHSGKASTRGKFGEVLRFRESYGTVRCGPVLFYIYGGAVRCYFISTVVRFGAVFRYRTTYKAFYDIEVHPNFF